MNSIYIPTVKARKVDVKVFVIFVDTAIGSNTGWKEEVTINGESMSKPYQQV